MRDVFALCFSVPIALSLGCALPGGGAEQRDASPPSIILIVTDDQGMGDYGHAGHPYLETPHLDRFALECPSVPRHYVSPVCSPTRASLMTGRYSQRTRVIDTWAGRSMMEPDEVTVAEVLGSAGYGTGIFGKWHLGDCYPMRPMDQGFDESLVHRGGGLAQPSEPLANGRRYTDPVLFKDGEPVQAEGYCTDVYFDAALEFIDEQITAEAPFFAYVATNAPHGPFHDVPEALYAKYRERIIAAVEPRDLSAAEDREARLCAMIENIDQNVGRLMAHLEERGVADDTLVVFMSDNGCIPGRFNAGLRGSKTTVYEGGIRSPLFVRWPGELKATTALQGATAHIDIMPTLLDVAGAQWPSGVRIDGRSLLGPLRGEPDPWMSRSLVLQAHRGNAPGREHQFAVVTDRWKLVRSSGFGVYEAPPDHPFELYDLRADPGESTDRAALRPDLVASLREEYGRWFDDVSSTREDNYAPPHIVVGDDAETLTVLTRQDLRPTDGEGWNGRGWWPLATESPVDVEVTLIFREPHALDEAQLSLGEKTLTFGPASASGRISLGSVTLPGGAFRFQVDCFHGGEPVSLHQVELARPAAAAPVTGGQ